jgi:DnaK suppressor protein
MEHGARPEDPVPQNLERIRAEAGLSPEVVRKLHQTLADRRRELIEEHEEHLAGGRLPPEERVSEAEEEAARTNLRETLLGLAEAERLLLQQIDRALRKIEDGTYGVSELSGEPIGADRLRAVPWARLTAPEQEELERQARGRRAM